MPHLARNNEGKFKSYPGMEPLLYANWKPGEPTSIRRHGGTENCIAIKRFKYHMNKLYWGDVDNAVRNQYICQKPRKQDITNNNTPKASTTTTTKTTTTTMTTSTTDSTMSDGNLSPILGEETKLDEEESNVGVILIIAVVAFVAIGIITVAAYRSSTNRRTLFRPVGRSRNNFSSAL